ncbi:hypothetical protein A9Q96_03980 [Rhodobacterales bacterium 52_120_T64]|nr:hypothetical protein A9Q96_03980 [Rhodobacterales bacterium 52_120_T64]
MMNNIGFSGVLVLAIAVFSLFVHFRISRRMGFSQGHSILISAISLFGLAVFVWWLSKWPNEARSNVDSGVDA